MVPPCLKNTPKAHASAFCVLTYAPPKITGAPRRSLLRKTRFGSPSKVHSQESTCRNRTACGSLGSTKALLLLFLIGFAFISINLFWGFVNSFFRFFLCCVKIYPITFREVKKPSSGRKVARCGVPRSELASFGGSRCGVPRSELASFGGSRVSVTEGARATLALHLLYHNALSLSRLRRQLPPGGSL